MQLKLFTQKAPQTTEDKEIRIQFVREMCAVLSRDPSLSAERQQLILIGVLIRANLSAKEIQEDIANRYAHN
ncbi:hypothetical protein [Legionella cherrii]|uniref:Uncharacterized protein n=1 Tax=Legionella cherrii TaxID=28084 RepID=A0A0W0SCE1_9GAMM|nr:hypothetical protein [Legionella cherrii]KTC81171.1 hypothetical protein Lche_3191 [Legionella cherrii]VEB33486.1 Uncharacterised protein [Legionella cherrii]